MGKPSFDLGENEIELGIGVHGEPGVKRVPMMLADDIAHWPQIEALDAVLEHFLEFVTPLSWRPFGAR